MLYHLFHYSAWDHYQADKSIITLFLLFILLQNWISCLLLGLPKCSECWNSVLKIKPNNSRRSSASSVKSLGCKLPGLAYFEMFAFISLCLRDTYNFLTERFLSVYHTRFKATDNCSVDKRLYRSANSSLSQDTEHVPYVVLKGKYPFSQPSVCFDSASIISLFPKAATVVFYLINILPLLWYCWKVPISIWL